jgi:hypothetical protein
MPAGISPGRFSSGVSTARKALDLYGYLPVPFPFMTNQYFDDFNTYTAGQWTVAPATGTSALTAGLGGNLTLTTGAVSGNGQGNALNPVSFAFTPGYQTWFEILFTCANGNIPNFVVGLTAGGAAAPTSGVYFTKATASRNISTLINKAASITTISNMPALQGASLDATALSLGFYYDGKATPTLYFYSSAGLVSNTSASPTPTAFGAPPIYGGAIVGSASADPANPNPLTNLPTVNLQPSFFVQTNAASTTTMVVDRIAAVCEINRF